MSMHKIPVTADEEEGLRKHGLAVGTPSQLSDCFRLGMAWQKAIAEARLRELEEALALAEDALCGITLNSRYLKEKMRKVLSATNRSGCHDWQLDGPSGEFESFYECRNCGACVVEDADGPSKPTTGCATA